MPTPEQIAQSSLFINEMYQEIETQLLENIGRLLATGEDITKDNVVAWQIQKLGQLGPLRQEQLNTIAVAANKTPDAVREWVQSIGYLAVNEIETGMAAALPSAAVPAVAESNALLATMLVYERNAIDTLNLVNTTLLDSSQQVYIDIINKATAEVLTGVKTHDQALRDVARQYADKGIPALTDKKGRKWSTEAYVNMVTRAVSAQVSARVQEERMNEYGVDLVEISSHAGSRPSHFDEQGKVYSRSGRSKLYPALSSTSYGKIDGIVTGINCAHVFYPFIHGKSIKRSQPYDKKQSVEAYKQSQQQRAIEREIRAAKKELRMMESMKDTKGIEDAKLKVRQKQAKMRRFIDETGRTRRRNREQIT